MSGYRFVDEREQQLELLISKEKKNPLLGALSVLLLGPFAYFYISVLHGIVASVLGLAWFYFLLWAGFSWSDSNGYVELLSLLLGLGLEFSLGYLPMLISMPLEIIKRNKKVELELRLKYGSK